MGIDYNKADVSEVKAHIVEKGDTLFQIAQDNGFSYQELAEYNNIEDPNYIDVGQTIEIPTEEVDISEYLEDQAENEEDVYIVQSGDNLFRIAMDNNISVEELAEYNHIENPDYIEVGQKIVIPKKDVQETENVEIDSASENKDTNTKSEMDKLVSQLASLSEKVMENVIWPAIQNTAPDVSWPNIQNMTSDVQEAEDVEIDSTSENKDTNAKSEQDISKGEILGVDPELRDDIAEPTKENPRIVTFRDPEVKNLGIDNIRKQIAQYQIGQLQYEELDDFLKGIVDGKIKVEEAPISDYTEHHEDVAIPNDRKMKILGKKTWPSFTKTGDTIWRYNEETGKYHILLENGGFSQTSYTIEEMNTIELY